MPWRVAPCRHAGLFGGKRMSDSGSVRFIWLGPEVRLAGPPQVSRPGWMAGFTGPGHVLLAAVMIALGLRGLACGDFASVWQRIPIEHLPARTFFVYATAVVELVAGVGLLLRRTVAAASAALFVFLVLWSILLKLPAVVVAPSMEATWLGLGEITTILAGSWAVFAVHADTRIRARLPFLVGARGVRGARLLLALSLPTIGLAHFFYLPQTVQLMPAWLPWHDGWAWLTGAASLAASLGILSGIAAGLAATLEATMLGIITLVIWLPGLVAAPADASLTPFLMSTAIACGASAVADSYRRRGR
jgi:uncharacterized membrane protein